MAKKNGESLMHFFRLTVAALVAIAAGQYSDELPAYSVESWCNKVAVIGGSGSEVIYRTCVTKERSAYDQLKDQWANLPAQTRQWCDRVATSGGDGSYSILQGCVEQEDAASSPV
jgi:S-adenosylmethionine:diacylglycerol 3-amino-3-carboxypropyl transferase